MPQSLANVLVHLVFSTKDRVPLIRSDVESELYAYTSRNSVTEHSLFRKSECSVTEFLILLLVMSDDDFNQKYGSV